MAVIDLLGSSNKAKWEDIASTIAGPGLSSFTGELRVNFNTDSLDIVSDVLEVKDESLTNAKIDPAAAIAYSKLNLTGSILNADLAGSIAGSKLLDDAITEPKIAMNNTPADGEVITWNASGSYMEWTDIDVVAIKESDIITAEVPTGLINGVNTSFTLANTPISGTVRVYLNGLRQEEGSGKDYTISGTTITFSNAPATNDILFVDYFIS